MIRVIRQHYDISTDPALGRMRRIVVSWLGLALLAFNLLASSGLAAQAAEQGPAAFTQELLGDRIVVCTAAGMVVFDRDGHPVNGDTGSGHSDLCVFCAPIMHGSLQTPVAISFVITPVEHRQPDLQPERLTSAPKPAQLSGSASPRAPPFA